MIICKNVKKEFHGEPPFCAIKDVSFHIAKGEFAALIGASGSGKSTMMNMIGLIDAPTTGSIFIDNCDTNKLSSSERADFRCRKIGYVFQSFYLEDTYTVAQNVEMPLLISETSAKFRQTRIDECLEYVGMLHKKNATVSTLSGGEKQRACIARAIANRPGLLLADEPCGNLDSDNSKNIMDLLFSLNKQGTTILLITHNMEEAKSASHVIELKDGLVILDEK